MSGIPVSFRSNYEVHFVTWTSIATANITSDHDNEVMQAQCRLHAGPQQTQKTRYYSTTTTSLSSTHPSNLLSDTKDYRTIQHLFVQDQTSHKESFRLQSATYNRLTTTMAVSKSNLITLATSVLIMAAMAVKEYDGTLNGEKVKVVLESVDVQSPITSSFFASYLGFVDYLKSFFGISHIDITNFTLNPLGLVLLLGVVSVNCAIGSLAFSGWAEYLPTLSSHTLATNEITNPLTGHTLYNITDKIKAVDVAGWFSRYLATQELKYSSTTIALKRRKSAKNATADSMEIKDLLAGLLSIGLFYLLARVASASNNGYATINGWCMLGLVVCRYLTVEQLRLGLDQMVKKALPKKDEKNSKDAYSVHDMCKVWLTMPNGNAIQIFGPRGLIRCLLMTPQPASMKTYTIAQYLSGVLLGIQALTLGMTSTTYQLTSLSILALSTVLLTSKTTLAPGTTTTTIGNELELTAWDNKDAGTHMSVYANMGLDKDEEESMRLWGLMPHASNKGWWTAYESNKEKMAGDAVEAMD